MGKNIWLNSLFFVGKPQKNWKPSFASNHTKNAHIPTSQLLMTSSLTSLRTIGFPLSAPPRILISYCLTSASLYNEENKLQ